MRMHGLVVLACLALTASAVTGGTDRPSADCVTDYKSTGDASLFPQQYMLVGDKTVAGSSVEVTSARGFSVQYYPTYKVVNNSIAGELYVLYQCGAGEPSHDQFPAGTKFFQVPLVSISVPETIPYAAMALLNLTDRVYDAPSFVTSPCGQRLLECGRTAPDSMELSNQTLLASTIGPVTDGLLVTGSNNFSTAFAYSSSMDPGVLNRSEWIKFLGLFFNKEYEASQLYQSMADQYDALKANASEVAASDKPVVAYVSHFAYGDSESYQISWADYKVQLVNDSGAQILPMADVAAIPGVQPDTYSPDTTLVFSWGTNTSFADQQEALDALLTALSKCALDALVWPAWMERGVTTKPVARRYLDIFRREAAEMRYIGGEGGPKQPSRGWPDARLPVLTWVPVDVLIDETYALDPNTYNVSSFLAAYNLTQQQAQQQPWFAEQKVFREDGLLSNDTGMGPGMDWYEGALVRPADLLRDMLRAVHPDIVQDASHIWFRNLFTEKPVTLGARDCQAQTQCSDLSPVPICPFVTVCPTNNPAYKATTALLKGSQGGACFYEKCESTGAAGNGTTAGGNSTAGTQGGNGTAVEGGNGKDAAQLAVPAVVVLTLAVVLVEVLLNFC
ncbi:hypothetical protein N2152v2_006480 [Parachlorella kessleri]